MTARVLTQSVGWLMVSHVATVLVGLATSIVISQVGAEELGRWRFAQAIVAYLMVGTDAGLTMLAVRELATRPTNASRYAGPILLIRLVLALVFVTTSALIIRPGPDNDAGWFYVAMSLTTVPAALSLAHVAQGFEMMRTYAVVRLASGAIAALAGLVAFKVTADLIAFAIPIVAIGLIVDLGLAGYLRSAAGLHFRLGTPRLWTQLLVGAVPFLIGALSIQLISNADAVIIRTVLGERELGLYAAAYVLAGQLLLLSGPVSWAIYPRLAAIHAQGGELERATREVSGALGLLVLPVCAGVALIAPSVVVGIYGQEYEPSIPLLAILMGMPLIGFYNSAMGQTLNAAMRHATVARVAALAASISILLNILLVPTFGLVAAAVAAVVTELITAVAYTRTMRPVSGLAPIRAYFATLDATIAMAVVVLVLREYPLPLTILVGVAVYLAVILVRRPASLATLIRIAGRRGR